MRMSVMPVDGLAPQMLIEHNEQSLIFDLSSYNKNYLIGDNDVTEHINAYWASLPGYKQEKIYDIYVQIRNIFEDVYQTSPLCIALMPLVKLLIAEHNLEDMERWVAFHTTIRIPATFEEAYIHNEERPFSREKTYTSSDYKKLVVLALALRSMVPVWGEFIYRTKAETGTSFKEYYAYSLLAQTRINESPAVEKLRIYISNNIQSEKSMPSIIVGGVGSEDYALWILSSLLVKRLSVGDIRGNDSNTNLVVTVHNDLTAKNNGSSGSNFGEPVLSKIFDSDTDNEQGVSRIENFKIKAEHSIGDIAIIEYYMSNYVGAAHRLLPEVDFGLLEEFVKAAMALQTEQIWQCQTSIAQWVLAPIVSPRGIYHLDKVTTIRALAVAQTYMWQKGHKKLACLITAIASDSGGSLLQSGIGSMARISREQAAEIGALFPYNRISGKRKNTIPPNPAVVAIDAVADGFNMRDWILTVPDRFAEEITGSQHHRRYSCPHDIKIALADLAIECAKRK